MSQEGLLQIKVREANELMKELEDKQEKLSNKLKEEDKLTIELMNRISSRIDQINDGKLSKEIGSICHKIVSEGIEEEKKVLRARMDNALKEIRVRSLQEIADINTNNLVLLNYLHSKSLVDIEEFRAYREKHYFKTFAMMKEVIETEKAIGLSSIQIKRGHQHEN